MKRKLVKLTAAGAALSMLAGCIVLSVYPFYTDKDVIFDAGLTGQWVKSGTTNEFWQFADVSGKFYMLTTIDTQDTNVFEAHLFQLKQNQFLDLLTTNRHEFELPMHLIAQVKRGDTNWSLHFLDYGWLAGLLQTNPAVLPHIIVPENSSDTNSGNMLYLTADTRELQHFLLKHVSDTNAFSADSVVELQRVPQ